MGVVVWFRSVYHQYRAQWVEYVAFGENGNTSQWMVYRILLELGVFVDAIYQHVLCLVDLSVAEAEPLSMDLLLLFVLRWTMRASVSVFCVAVWWGQSSSGGQPQLDEPTGDVEFRYQQSTASGANGEPPKRWSLYASLAVLSDCFDFVLMDLYRIWIGLYSSLRSSFMLAID